MSGVAITCKFFHPLPPQKDKFYAPGVIDPEDPTMVLHCPQCANSIPASKVMDGGVTITCTRCDAVIQVDVTILKKGRNVSVLPTTGRVST